jgi:hypothetical protein
MLTRFLGGRYENRRWSHPAGELEWLGCPRPGPGPGQGPSPAAAGEIRAERHGLVVRKSKARPPGKRRPSRLYPSLAKGPTPEERLAQLLKDAEAKGIKPIDEAALEAMGRVWPADEDLDEFLAWLYESRRSGRYG